MTRHCAYLAPLIASCLMLSPSAEAQTSPDLLDTTCGDFAVALRAADPGKNPTIEQKTAALDAQDDIIDGLLWVHGYRWACGSRCQACGAHPRMDGRLCRAAGKSLHR